jgi:membrane peptidoglycan carboxypeptidase
LCEEGHLALEVEPVSPSRFLWNVMVDRPNWPSSELGWHMASLAARRWIADHPHRRHLRQGFDHLAATMWLTRHWNAAQMTQVWMSEAWFGRGAGGFSMAASAYYGKAPGDLSLHELALLAALPQSPSRFDPACFPDEARLARDNLLRRLFLTGAVSSSEHTLAMAQPLGVIYTPCRS